MINWLNSNLLTLNIGKTKYLTFSTQERFQPKNIHIRVHICSRNVRGCNCSYLDRVSEMRYLGVILDGSLTWKQHIVALINRIRKLSAIFKRLRCVADVEVLKIAYYALCQSLLNYCVLAWGGTFKSVILQLERAQRIALKVMLRKPYRFPTKCLFDETNLLSVRQLFIVKSILYCHKNNPIDINVSTKRRRDGVYNVPRSTTSFRQRHQVFLGPYLYNKLSKYIVLFPLTVFECKKVLTNYLKTLCYELFTILK